MSFKAVAVFTLFAVATAQPHAKRHHHHHHGTGTGTGGFTIPTGGPYGMSNGTFGTGLSTGAPAVVTETVVPLPVSSSAADFAVSSLGVEGAAVENIAASTVNADAFGTTSCLSTSTSTVTSMNYFTTTVTAGQDQVASPSTSVADFGAYESQSSAVSLSTSASVAAGAFFNRPSSFGGFGSSSFAPASVSTTFATAVIPSSGAPSFLPSSAAPSFVTSAGAASVSVSMVASASSAVPSVVGGSSSGKKGLSYNDASLTSAFDNTGMTWAYNWGAAPGGTIGTGMEYVPMLWGTNDVSTWASDAAAAIAAGSTEVLGFNEPDLSTQSNLSPAAAAAGHIANMGGISVRVGSPAITNGAGSNPPMGTTWLQQFFEACAGQCKVDFVAFHYYADASSIDDFESHVQDVISTAAANGVSKVWLTEFGVTGSDADVSSFLSDAITYLDSQPAVERYAYFMCSDGILLDGTTISALGEVYATSD